MPFDLCQHYIDWVLPPTSDTAGGAQTRPPTSFEALKLVSQRQHATTYVVPKPKITTFIDVLMLVCVSKVGAQPPFFRFEERREFYLYLCLCLVLIACFGCLLWGDAGGRFKCELSYHTRVHDGYRRALSFTHLISSGETTTLLLSVRLPIGQGLLSLLCYQKRGSTGCSQTRVLSKPATFLGGIFFLFFFLIYIMLCE